MNNYTKRQMLADFETLADASIPTAVFNASERIRGYVASSEERLSRARAEALGEAAHKSEERARTHLEWGRNERALDFESFADDLRALITTPAPATIPVEKVREVLRALIATDRDRLREHDRNVGDLVLMEVARRLDIPLDSTEPNP